MNVPQQLYNWMYVCNQHNLKSCEQIWKKFGNWIILANLANTDTQKLLDKFSQKNLCWFGLHQGTNVQCFGRDSDPDLYPESGSSIIFSKEVTQEMMDRV